MIHSVMEIQLGCIENPVVVLFLFNLLTFSIANSANF